MLTYANIIWSYTFMFYQPHDLMSKRQVGKIISKMNFGTIHRELTNGGLRQEVDN